MAKTLVVCLTMVAVFAITEIKVYREPSQEFRAITALRAIASSQRAYAVVNGGYAMSLKALAATCAGGRHISPDLSSDPAVTRGYEIRLQAAADAPTGHVDCHGNPTARAYYATAVPLRRTGRPCARSLSTKTTSSGTTRLGQLLNHLFLRPIR